MSVIIKGATMPRTCVDCPLFRESAFGFDLCKGKGIGFVAEDAKWLDATRVNWCPLVELPKEHGRLIDADKLRSEFPYPKDWRNPKEALVHLTDIWAEIDCAETVVEREGG